MGGAQLSRVLSFLRWTPETSMELCWPAPTEDQPWHFYLTNGKHSCDRNKYMAEPELNSSGEFCQLIKKQKKILEWMMLAKLFRGYILFDIYARKNQPWSEGKAFYLEFLVYMSLRQWEAAAGCSFLMLPYSVSKFTANLESSSVSHFERGRWSFSSRTNLLSPGYPAGEVRSPRLALEGTDSPTVPKRSRPWAEICFWWSLTYWVTLREITSILLSMS